MQDSGPPAGPARVHRSGLGGHCPGLERAGCGHAAVPQSGRGAGAGRADVAGHGGDRRSGRPDRPVEFLRAVREVDGTVPVIVGVDDRQPRMGPDALSAGATAVVPRPFCAGDLLRRLHATAGDEPPIGPLPLNVGRLRVDGAAPRMWLDGVETVLPPLEFRLLRYLAERQGEILPRRELLIAAWGDRPTVSR